MSGVKDQSAADTAVRIFKEHGTGILHGDAFLIDKIHRESRLGGNRRSEDIHPLDRQKAVLDALDREVKKPNSRVSKFYVPVSAGLVGGGLRYVRGFELRLPEHGWCTTHRQWESITCSELDQTRKFPDAKARQ